MGNSFFAVCGFTRSSAGPRSGTDSGNPGSASAANVKSIINLRPFVRIPDVLASYKLMKSLNPEMVVPGHGAVTTTKIFDEYEGSYNLLVKRVGEMAAQRKSLDEIKKELKMPEYADWAGQNNLPQNITVAYESIKK